MIVESRLAAAHALGRVLRGGAWANVVLDRTHSGGAAQALLYAALRRLPLVDSLIEKGSRRPVSSIDDRLLDLLRVVATELTSGSDRPIEVVVDTGVTGAGELDGRYRGLANAVLRRVAEGGVVHPGSPSQRGIPGWLVERTRPYLEDEIWEVLDQPAPVGIRSVPPVDGAAPVPGIPGAWLWSGGEPPPGAVIQDPASVAVGNAVGVGAGMTVLDVGAAPGGKTSHLVEQAGPDGRVVATDLHLRRTMTGRRRVPAGRWIVADGARPAFRPASFDRILVDASCTGLGILRRRPEIRYRVTEEEVTRLAGLQRRMLETSLAMLKPGGRLVYSVCTFTPDETIGVVAGLGGRSPADLPGRPWGDGWLMSPLDGPTDGMFVTVFER